MLYWQIGQNILIKQKQNSWGAKIIDKLSQDLQRANLEMSGLSPRNLQYMRAFAEAWPDELFVQEHLTQITWYHNITLIEKLTSKEERLWYADKAVEHGWSRNILVLQIENKLYQRQGGASTNFSRTLPPPQSDLAHQLLKDPYNFDFLNLGKEAQEREIERSLLGHIREFLIELGSGFAFVGNQYHLEVAGKDYYLDLLFYHLKLRCYVVIDLKAAEFRPEDVGKMNFYLSAVDDLLRHADDKPSIGLILAKSKNKIEAEYALRNINTPIGISEFQLTKALPEKLKGSLPTIEELEAELESSSEERQE
jgi:predicted nuclease of restriction endonuclease-like (RecB) superfamily